MSNIEKNALARRPTLQPIGAAKAAAAAAANGDSTLCKSRGGGLVKDRANRHIPNAVILAEAVFLRIARNHARETKNINREYR